MNIFNHNIYETGQALHQNWANVSKRPETMLCFFIPQKIQVLSRSDVVLMSDHRLRRYTNINPEDEIFCINQGVQRLFFNLKSS